MHTPSSIWTDVDVLVVGAGPSGLTTAISAARHGASVLLVEKHEHLSHFPKATGVRPRVMEILRSWGLEEAVRSASQPARLSMLITPMLAVPGTELSIGLPEEGDVAAVSPSRLAVCPQDRLEAILLAHLRDESLGFDADVWFGHELCGFETASDGTGVRAVIEGPTGMRTVTARFLVGADGARSRVRADAGIALEELGSEGNHLSALFRADLSGLVAEPPYALTMTVAPGLEGMLVATGERDRWIYDIEWHPDLGETLDDWPEERLVERLRAVTGRADLQPEILGLFPWDFGAAVAAEQRRGPVFLVGDAAHRTTPRGATGMNTGMADGHNLGWKLAWVARGLAGPSLLDSYEQERGPVGRANAEASLVSRIGQPAAASLDHDFGVVYASDAILDSGRLSGRRAPHAWVEVAGRQRSTLDLFDGKLTVISGPAGEQVLRTSRELAASGLPVRAYRVGAEILDFDRRLDQVYGLGRDGWVVVRPDGYVAASQPSGGDDAGMTVERQIRAALGRQPVALPAR